MPAVWENVPSVTGMEAAEWDEVKQAFAASLELGSGRAAYLDRRFGGAPELRAEVESLLAAHDGAGRFLDRPAIDLPRPPDTTIETLAPGTRLGVYTIVQKIDEGGMAMVYQALRDDAEFRKLVAIKVLKPGMDAGLILERFHNEKQILAHFDHPNIAMLLDSGTTPGGHSYFVLEFIAGHPLTAYCDDRRLGIDERLRLFQRVCGAVEYAHQNLIVHRDLKPRNILVTEDGEPKLLDFGIAKILSDERELTLSGMRPMTPQYASPEQIRGEPVSTATDIYGLGVILYELLTGCRPFGGGDTSPHELARLILETVPKRPSTALRGNGDWPPCEAANSARWARQLRGDLDNIVLKAMHPEPRRRYRSVGELATDIDRYFGGLPVLAAGDDWRYRARKFVHRYRGAVIAGAFVVTSLAAGLLAVEHEVVVARRQRELAERRAAQIRRLANSLIYELHDAIQSLPGSTPVRAKLMDRATEALDSLKSGADNASTRRELATAYARLADVQGSPQDFNVGDMAGAMRNYRSALGLLEDVRKASPADLSVQRAMAEIEWPLSAILERQGDLKGATEMAQSALDRRMAIAQAERGVEARRDLAKAYYLRGNTAVLTGDLATARAAREKALQLWEGIAAENHGNATVAFQVALSAKNLAAVEQRLKDFPTARRHLEQALAIDEERSRAAPADPNIRLDVSFDLSELGALAYALGDIAGSAERFRQARAIREELLAHDAENQRLRERVAYIRNREGQVELTLGHMAESLAAFLRSLELRRDLARDPDNRGAQFEMAEAEGELGQWYCVNRQYESGQTMLRGAAARVAELDQLKALTLEQKESAAEIRQHLAACHSPNR
jgi:eukaryotic-like serine/threonine-protein kinase